MPVLFAPTGALKPLLRLQVTLLNTILESGSDVTQKVVEAHLRTCEFTRSKLRAFLDKAWQTPQFVTCPAHMVSGVECTARVRIK